MFDLDRWNEIFITISRNKVRSILTAFGVFWGVFMLVALLGGGNGLEKSISKNFSELATNSCFMWSGRTSEAYKGFRKGRRWQIINRDIEIIKANVKGLDEISPLITPWSPTSDNAVRGDKKGTVNITGSYANYNKIDNHTMMFGRYLNDMDVQEQRKVCLIGSRVYEALFNRGEDPIGKDIRVDGVYYKVIGVGEGSDNINFNGDKREAVTIPFTTMQKLYNYGDHVDIVCIMAKSGVAVSEVQEQIESILKVNHSIAPQDKQAINSFNLEEIFTQIGYLFLGVNILAWIVGFGTLFAGIIGVSNIMMVTVRERTQEIGIRRALGAKPSTIMTQIMSESFTITAIAGFLGISFGVLVLQMFDLSISEDGGATSVFQISFFTAVSAALIIIILGTLAGLGPAFRAMKIKPIEALSEE
ncbi:MAG: ABC transporter permease [Prevotellaceae bacterium]|jgi:putative ABC transport system permease protein|nr:ABC transporter permease [Prevotellaceae bacterium]